MTKVEGQAELIRGVELAVNGRELGVRVEARARWHRERADTIIEQLARLAELEQQAAEDLSDIFGHYNSPRTQLEKRLREHQERAELLGFIRDHLLPDAIYRLGASDLNTIGLMRRNVHA